MLRTAIVTPHLFCIHREKVRAMEGDVIGGPPDSHPGVVGVHIAFKAAAFL